jgi:dATP pyrophosphohydrolase
VLRRVRVSHVEVYVFRRRGRRVELLCLRRVPTRIALPGAWQPVTGRIERGERALVAAAREVREETGLVPVRWWGLETMPMWFESATEEVAALPLYAAEVEPGAQVVLSREHDDLAWLPLRAAGARFMWESQRRGVAALEREVLRSRSAGVLERTALLATLRRGAKRTRRARPRQARRR